MILLSLILRLDYLNKRQVFGVFYECAESIPPIEITSTLGESILISRVLRCDMHSVLDVPIFKFIRCVLETQ